MQTTLPPLPQLDAVGQLLPDASGPSDKEWTEESLKIPEGTVRRKAIINTVHAIWRLRRIEEDVNADDQWKWHKHLAFWLVSMPNDLNNWSKVIEFYDSKDQHLKACAYSRIEILPVVVQFAVDAVGIGMYHWRMIPVEMLNAEQLQLRLEDIRSLGGSNTDSQASAGPSSVVVAKKGPTPASTSTKKPADPTKKSARPLALPESESEGGHSDSAPSIMTSKTESSSKGATSIASTKARAQDSFDGVVVPIRTRSAAANPQTTSRDPGDLGGLKFEQGDLVRPHLKVPKDLVSSNFLLVVAIIRSRPSRCVIAARACQNRSCVHLCG